MYPKVTGIPASCICATYPSELAALIPSKPGKPGLPAGSVIGVEPSTVDTAGPPAIAGSTYLAPNRPWNPAYPPGSSGSTSGLALPFAQTAEPCAQCTPMPTKSAWASVALAFASWSSGEPGPKTLGTSGPVFSRIVLAVDTAPKSQPALVYAAHGAGETLPSGPTIVGVGSLGVEVAGSKTPSVQY